MVLLGIINSMFGYFNRIFVPFLSINRNINLLGKHFELFDCRRAINVTCNKQWTFPFIALEFFCKFSGERRFTGTLQPRHKNHCGITRQVNLCGIATHERCKLIVHDFHHQFLRFDGIYHILTKCFGLYRVCECLCNLIIDVGIKKCTPYIFQGFGHIDFGNLTLAFQYFKTTLKFLA